jgi:hypothetical protein
MRISIILALVGIGVACSGGGGDNDDLNDTSDTTVSGTCPDGLAPASTAGGLITAYIQNGAGLALTFDPNAITADGQLAACVSSDSLLAQWVLSTAGQPAVIVRQSISSFGAQPTDGSTASMTLEIVGFETTSPADWQTALWTVDVSGSTMTSIIDGTAISSSGGIYRLNAALEITP